MIFPSADAALDASTDVDGMDICALHTLLLFYCTYSVTIEAKLESDYPAGDKLCCPVSFLIILFQSLYADIFEARVSQLRAGLLYSNVHGSSKYGFPSFQSANGLV
jgi:hypothetical protein